MREIIRSGQFKRDVKLAEKRHKDLAKLREIILLLVEGRPLPARYRDHALTGRVEELSRCAYRTGLAVAVQDRWR